MSQNLQVIVGLGATGISCARFLQKKGLPFAMVDTRATPPQLETFKQEFPDIPIVLGGLDEALLNKASRLIVSPGISLKEPLIAKQLARGIPVIGDIELFAEEVRAPVIAITGTNAKSTVTTLMGEMALAANLRAQVGGNLGVPALDLLTPEQADVFVLELSSFQLETTYSLKPRVATILNITPDHMDRYATLEDYIAAKQRVYINCDIAVCNRDDENTQYDKTKKISFTLETPGANEFGLLKKNGETYLAYEDKALLAIRELPILGRHYQANALAALAIGYAFGLAMEPMLETLKSFKGLAHRCQLVRELNDISWYNDSKGTNVGAALAAINGLGSEIRGKLILIAGGLGKNADFSPLIPAIKKYVRTVVLIGEAAPILADVINDNAEIKLAKTMDDAVALSKQAALPGDSVLLSPACASWDMYKNFEHRGQVFTTIVQGL